MGAQVRFEALVLPADGFAGMDEDESGDSVDEHRVPGLDELHGVGDSGQGRDPRRAQQDRRVRSLGAELRHDSPDAL